MKSWISVSAESHFPIQNLPIGVFSTASSNFPRSGVAIGDFVVDLLALHQCGALSGLEFDTSVFGEPTLNSFMALTRPSWRALRARLTDLLQEGGDDTMRNNESVKSQCLVNMADVQMHLPATIGDYTDFYSSREHATNVGTMFRGPDNALQPNWLHLPVGYHGRSSSIVISGTDVVRPSGQLQAHPTDEKQGSVYGPCKLLDFELEMAFFVGGGGNPLGRPLTMAEAEDRIFGMVLMNDWSARDIQKWEYVPLGPFTAKNFATSVSPWIVSLDALEPFRCTSSAGPLQENPTPLPYITDPEYHRGAYDIKLEVALQPSDEGQSSTITRSNFRHMYWNMKQQLVHHSVSGCNMQPGDLLGSGTISGADETAFGSMLELSWKGAKEISLVNSPTNAIRKFLKDGDNVIMTGFAQLEGSYRIGFGDVSGKILSTAPSTEAPSAQIVGGKGYSNFTLYSYWRSTCSWRVRIALALKGIEYKNEPMDLSTLVGNTTACLPSSFTSDVNPLGQVPALTFLAPDGSIQTLTQSLAIIEFLDAIFPTPPLLPKDPLQRAKVMQIAEVVNSNIQPMQNLAVLRQVKQAQLLGEEAMTDGKGFATKNIEKGLAVLEQLVVASQSSKLGSFVGFKKGSLFSAGTSFPTVADLCIIPQLYNANRFGIDLSPYPSLTAVQTLCDALTAFQDARPERQPDYSP